MADRSGRTNFSSTAAYETYDYHSTTPEATTILTPAARRGIFTYRTNGNSPIQTYNVLTNPEATPRLRLTIDKTAAGLLSQVPLVGNSTQVGDGLNTTGYQFNARSNERRDNIEGKGGLQPLAEERLQRNLSAGTATTTTVRTYLQDSA